MFIFMFLSINTIFSNLTKNVVKIFKLEKKFRIIFFSCPPYDFLTENNYNFFLQMIFVHKLHFHVHYDEIY